MKSLIVYSATNYELEWDTSTSLNYAIITNTSDRLSPAQLWTNILKKKEISAPNTFRFVPNIIGFQYLKNDVFIHHIITPKLLAISELSQSNAWASMFHTECFASQKMCLVFMPVWVTNLNSLNHRLKYCKLLFVQPPPTMLT